MFFLFNVYSILRVWNGRGGDVLCGHRGNDGRDGDCRDGDCRDDVLVVDEVHHLRPCLVLRASILEFFLP